MTSEVRRRAPSWGKTCLRTSESQSDLENACRTHQVSWEKSRRRCGGRNTHISPRSDAFGYSLLCLPGFEPRPNLPLRLLHDHLHPPASMLEPREHERVQLRRSAALGRRRRPLGDRGGNFRQDELVEDVVPDESGQKGRPRGEKLDRRVRLARLPRVAVRGSVVSGCPQARVTAGPQRT